MLCLASVHVYWVTFGAAMSLLGLYYQSVMLWSDNSWLTKGCILQSLCNSGSSLPNGQNLFSHHRVIRSHEVKMGNLSITSIPGLARGIKEMNPLRSLYLILFFSMIIWKVDACEFSLEPMSESPNTVPMSITHTYKSLKGGRHRTIKLVSL